MARVARRGMLRFVPIFIALAYAGLAEAIPGPDPAPGPAPDPAPATPGFSFFRDAAAESREPQLVALLLNGRERTEGLAFRAASESQPADVALEMFAAAAGLPWRRESDGWVLVTPIGDARIALDAVSYEGEVAYIPLDRLAAAIAGSLSFDAAEFAVRAEVPWQPDTPEAVAAIAARQTPDVRAPAASIAGIRAELVGTHVDGQTSTSLNAITGGLLGPGYWRADLSGFNANGERRIDGNALWWAVDFGNSRALAGVDRLYLHPVLETFELSGAQYAWTNAPGTVFDGGYAGYGAGGQLVPYRAAPTSVVRGEGPPGGIAELRIAGQAIEKRPIQLDGRYEFRNVPAQPGDSLRVEVAVYAFGRPGTPVRVDEYYSQAGNLQLPAGVAVHYAGAGRAGNPLREGGDSLGTGGAGFYQYRQGISDRVTLDLIAQDIDGASTAVGGVAVNLGLLGAWAAYGGRGNEGNTAWQVLGDGQRHAWFWRADLMHRDADFWRDGDIGVDNQRVEAGRHFGEPVRVSLIYGHYEAPGTEDIDFVRPAAFWRPLDNFSMSAQPDFNGDYTYNLQWAPDPLSMVALTRYDGLTQLDYDRQLSNAVRGRASLFDDDRYGNRYGAFLYGSANFERRLSWSAGLLGGDGGFGYVGDLNFEFSPGLSTRLRVQDDPIFGDPGSPIVQLALVADLAFTGSGVTRGFGLGSGAAQVGGLVGAVAVPEALKLSGDALEGLAVLVDGQVRGRTTAGGRFHIVGLAAGVHKVELDGEGLPIELSVRDAEHWVEIRPGGTTRVGFSASLRLGVAGRIDPARPGADSLWTVQARDMDGEARGSGTATAFGYFRIDGLPPGRSTLVLRAEDGTEVATRELELADRFLFEQNLDSNKP